MNITPSFFPNRLKLYLPLKRQFSTDFRYKAYAYSECLEIEIPLLTCHSGHDRYMVAVTPLILPVNQIVIFERNTNHKIAEFTLSEAKRNKKINDCVFKDLSLAQVCDNLDAQNPLLRNQFDMNLFDCFVTTERNIVWRIAIDWKGSPKSKPVFKLFSQDEHIVDGAVNDFEYQENLKRDEGDVCRVIVSFSTPADKSDFSLFAYDPQHEIAPNFYAMETQAALSLLNQGSDPRANVDEQANLYSEWIKSHLSSIKAEGLRYDNVGMDGLHVIVFALNESFYEIAKSVDSLKLQGYKEWQATVLCSREPADIDFSDNRIRTISLSDEDIPIALQEIASTASMKHMCFIEAGDVFAEGAFSILANSIGDQDHVVVFDEDVVDQTGIHSHPRFKGNLNRQLEYSEGWLGYGVVFPTTLVSSVRLIPGIHTPNIVSYAVALFAMERNYSFFSIPKILLHISSKTAQPRLIQNGAFLEEEIDVAKQLLSQHLANSGTEALIVDGLLAGTIRISLKPKATPGKVSIIIPTQDHSEMLNRCVNSILGKTTYTDLEIILVENNSKDDKTFALYERLESENPGIVKVVIWEGHFNYSAIINFGVSASSGRFLLLLNNDTEVIVPSFIEEMLALAIIPEVGVVGAKLYFKDMLIQHAGMLIGPYNGISHVNQNLSDITPGYQNRTLTTCSFSSVTGACQMVRREVFNQVGGYDDTFAVGFNDADFCLKVRNAGYDVVFTPYAELFHYEFATRGRELIDEAKQKRWEGERDTFFSKWEEVLRDGDPLVSPNFDKDNWYYALPLTED